MGDQTLEQPATDGDVGNVDVSVGTDMGLSEDMVYGNAPPAAPEAEPAKPAGEPEAPASKPGEEPAPEAPADAAPAAAPTAAAAPEEPAPVVAPWSTERQIADQQNANLRRTNADLRAQLEASRRSGDEPADAAAEMADISSELEGVGKDIEALDDFGDATEVKALLIKQNGLMVKQANLQQQLSSDATVARDAAQATVDKTAYDAILNGVCAEVGEEFRNDILKGMVKVWSDRGYTAQTQVPPGQVEDAAFAIGRKLALTKKPAGGGTKPAPGPAASPGTGGAPAAPKLPSGETLEETMANMSKEGKFQQ